VLLSNFHAWGLLGGEAAWPMRRKVVIEINFEGGASESKN